MKHKIVCIFVLMLLIATAVPPVIGMTTQQNDFGNDDYFTHYSKGIQSSDVSNKVQKTTKPLGITGTPFYGYVTYDPLHLLTLGPCSFMPTNPGLITSLAPTSSTSFLSGGTWAKGIWYGCECFGDPYIWTINPVTGAMTTLGSYDPTGIGLDFFGLAYDQITDKLYGCSGTDLYSVSMSNGASTHIGPFNQVSGMIGIAFDSSGNLYGTDIYTKNLYSINPSTGTATIVGPLNIDILYAQDMSFDWDTGILYLAAYTITPIQEGALYTCNPGSGATTKVDSFENGAQISCFAIPFNSPPTPPTISGPTNAGAGISHSYTFTSTDPEGEQIQYYIDWDDGSPPTWSTSQTSGVPYPASHTWNTQGSYIIKSKTKDASGVESALSTYPITIPKNKNLLQSPFWYRVFERFPNMFALLRQLIL